MTSELTVPTRQAAQRMADAAAAWVESLDDRQRRLGAWAWSPRADEPAEAERLRWYYTPTDHGGLTLHGMRPDQQRAAMRLLSTGLSEAAYTTASTIMGLENVLDRTEDFGAGFARERGRDPGMYYLRVFGTPAPRGTWAWRFGGHHLSVHHLVVDGAVAAGTPCFLGADPAVSPLLGGAQLRPLGAVEDLARDLLHSLDPEQRSRAVLSATPPVDIVAGNRVRVTEGDRLIPLPDLWRGHFTGEHAPIEARLWSMHNDLEAHLGVTDTDHEAVALTATPKGIAARDLSTAQRETLRAIVDVHVGRMPPGVREQETARFAGELLGDVHFAWAGGPRRGDPHYYRLQGPQILAEWDLTQREANHAHSVWRDPGRDFGLDLLAAHYNAHHGTTPRSAG